MIDKTRIDMILDYPIDNGEYVLYWMHQSQRTSCNHSLAYGIQMSNELNIPLVVLFCIADNFPQSSLRHYHFMLQGLQEVEKELTAMGISFILMHSSPLKAVSHLSEKSALIITDRAYLKPQREWVSKIKKRIKRPFLQIESDIIVPVETAYPKESYSAAHLRPKINGLLPLYLHQVKNKKIIQRGFPHSLKNHSLPLTDIDKILSELNIDRSIPPVTWLKGGTSQAKKLLKKFISTKLDLYDKNHNDPSMDFCSHMSPYLRFGQISPIYIALEISKTESPSKETFLEQLIVRRELSINFTHYNDNYDSPDSLPRWARDSLESHEKDIREYNYSLKELEEFNTHDRFWNAAQKELVITGKMHNYMRMYWGKKIIQWVSSTKSAFEFALYLNNKYGLDGNDPNSFTGVAWCFGKHDRPWQERPIFGKIRYMNDKGLIRKFNIDEYVNKINNL